MSQYKVFFESSNFQQTSCKLQPLPPLHLFLAQKILNFFGGGEREAYQMSETGSPFCNNMARKHFALQ